MIYNVYRSDKWLSCDDVNLVLCLLDLKIGCTATISKRNTNNKDNSNIATVFNKENEWLVYCSYIPEPNWVVDLRINLNKT